MKAPRLTVFVPVLVGLLWPVATVAVGLGDATVTSRLNEPLSVEISLVGAELSSSNTHVIGIASASAHAAAGIAYTPLVQQLKVKVVSGHGGNTIIKAARRNGLISIAIPATIITDKGRYQSVPTPNHRSAFQADFRHEPT